MRRKRTPEDPCRICSNPMTDHTKTSLNSGRCRSCYNDWFTEWVARSAEKGTLTGKRAVRNQPNFKKLLMAGAGMSHPLTKRPPGDLSDAELKVLSLVCDGKSNAEIAVDLNRSVKTIESHRTRINAKFGVHNPVMVVREAIRRGLVQP